MPITAVGPENARQLQQIADVVAKAKKIVMITGAGISTNSGIPDFRSHNGFYSLIKSEQNSESAHNITSSPRHIKARDLFDSNLWKDEQSTATFYQFTASLRRKIRGEVSAATPTHKFIHVLKDRRKLVRCYTQNIDGLEAREDLCLDLSRGKGSRSRFTKRSLELPNSTANLLQGAALDGGCEVVQLHGELQTLRCTICLETFEWDKDIEAMLLKGSSPPCSVCAAKDTGRRTKGKRGSAIGTLRPSIVLYGEEHPSAEIISPIITSDLRLGPDLLLILGTSLKVHGLKNIVREFAKSVHAKKTGYVVFINATSPVESTWKDVIDYWIDMDCDEWVEDLHKRRSDLWQKQISLSLTTAKKGPPNLASSEFKIGSSNEGEEKENNVAVPSTPSTKQCNKTNAIIPTGFITPRRTPRSKKHNPLGERVNPQSRSPTGRIKEAVATTNGTRTPAADLMEIPPHKLRGQSISIYVDEDDDTSSSCDNSEPVGQNRVEIPSTPSRTGEKRKRA